jgi:hypothetical protein
MNICGIDCKINKDDGRVRERGDWQRGIGNWGPMVQETARPKSRYSFLHLRIQIHGLCKNVPQRVALCNS